MAPEVDTVNMTSRPYHHGHLREALVDAALELARTGGPEAVVLRAATRAAGVSHNAAYRHFADRDELIRAVGERCTSMLAALMERGTGAVTETDPVLAAWARLDAIGRAYVGFAVSEPGWFRTCFGAAVDAGAPGSGAPGSAAPGSAAPGSVAPGSVAPGSGVCGDIGPRPYDLLGACLDDLVAVGAVPVERRPGLEFAAWSAVHGLSTLMLDGPLRDLPAGEREQVLSTVLGVVSRGL
jgi:AcrR family transcriptional regulator